MKALTIEQEVIISYFLHSYEPSLLPRFLALFGNAEMPPTHEQHKKILQDEAEFQLEKVKDMIFPGRKEKSNSEKVEPLEISIDQIAEKFNVKPENIKIKDFTNNIEAMKDLTDTLRSFPEVKTINISIEKLVESMNITSDDSPQKLKEKLTQALVSAIKESEITLK